MISPHSPKPLVLAVDKDAGSASCSGRQRAPRYTFEAVVGPNSRGNLSKGLDHVLKIGRVPRGHCRSASRASKMSASVMLTRKAPSAATKALWKKFSAAFARASKLRMAAALLNLAWHSSKRSLCISLQPLAPATDALHDALISTRAGFSKSIHTRSILDRWIPARVQQKGQGCPCLRD